MHTEWRCFYGDTVYMILAVMGPKVALRGPLFSPSPRDVEAVRADCSGIHGLRLFGSGA